MFRIKKDARLYFKYIKFGGLDIDLGALKTLLIKTGYICHVEGDKYEELKKMPNVEKLRELM